MKEKKNKALLVFSDTEKEMIFDLMQVYEKKNGKVTRIGLFRLLVREKHSELCKPSHYNPKRANAILSNEKPA